MRTVFVYLVLALGSYLCQTVIYPVLVVPELRVDLLLILVIHSSLFHERLGALLLALFSGLLMDVGLPLNGSFYPLLYLGCALLTQVLKQNLNLNSRRYQAVFLGLCASFEGLGVWIVLMPHGAGSVEAQHTLYIVALRIIATSLIGLPVLSALERLDQLLSSHSSLKQSQEG